MPADALLLDVGYVIIDVNWSAVAAYAEVSGRAMPEPDDAPHADEPRLGSTSTNDGYWGRVGRLAGFDSFLDFFRTMLFTVPEAMIDPAATTLISDARVAGKRTGALSNDAYTIAGREFFAGRPEFTELDVFVDAAEIGIRKPAAGAYLRAADELGVAPERIVFLDDTPDCVDGAMAVGMAAIQVDPAHKAPAFDRARSILGLQSET